MVKNSEDFILLTINPALARIKKYVRDTGKSKTMKISYRKDQDHVVVPRIREITKNDKFLSGLSIKVSYVENQDSNYYDFCYIMVEKL